MVTGSDQQVGVVSFNILDVNPEDVGSVLDEVYNIMVRTGLHCAPQAHRTIGTIGRGTVRVSPSFSIQRMKSYTFSMQSERLPVRQGVPEQ